MNASIGDLDPEDFSRGWQGSVVQYTLPKRGKKCSTSTTEQSCLGFETTCVMVLWPRVATWQEPAKRRSSAPMAKTQRRRVHHLYPTTNNVSASPSPIPHVIDNLATDLEGLSSIRLEEPFLDLSFPCSDCDRTDDHVEQNCKRSAQ